MKTSINIEVDFLVKRNGTFEELENESATSRKPERIHPLWNFFDGRFPCLSSEDNPVISLEIMTDLSRVYYL